MKVLLNCFPPSEVSMPDLGLSVLKQYLSNKEIECDILYWNILLYNYSKEIVPYNTSNDVVGIFLPYLFCLNNGCNEKMDLLLQSKNPSWTVLEMDYYQKYLLETSDNIQKYMNEIISDKGLDIYNVIGISYKFSQWIPALVFIRELKKRNPNIKTVIGGIPSMVEAQKFMETFHKDIDYAIWGEGEIALHKLVEFLQVNDDSPTNLPHDIHSLVYMNQSEIVTNRCRTLYSEMVIPDFSDFVNQYNIESISPTLNVENSRGCYWNKCKFCYLNEGYKFRRKTNEQVIKSIDDTVNKYKINRLFFNDNDLCGANIKQFESLLDSLIAYKKTTNLIFIVGEFNSKKLNKNIIEKISLAGFKMMQIGIESISDRKLKKIDKHASFINHLLSFKFCNKYSLIITGSNLITGFPDDDIQDVIDTANNLHYLRFYFKSGLFFRLTDLCVKATSKYYSGMDEKDRNNLYSTLSLLIADEDILKNKFYFFEHISFGKKGLWTYLSEILQFYINGKFTYKVCKQKTADLLSFLYTEYYNDKQIIDLAFNELEWSIIEECSNDIIQIEELICKVTGKHPDVSPTTIKKIISDLSKERLLYIDHYTEEVFCIIDSEVFDRLL
jgi:radical SAM superfamily enzyme YgiQ (UPF0313 family)